MDDPEELESNPVPPEPMPEEGESSWEGADREKPAQAPAEGDPLSSVRESLEEPSDADKKAPFSRRFMEWLAFTAAAKQPVPGGEPEQAEGESLPELGDLPTGFDHQQAELSPEPEEADITEPELESYATGTETGGDESDRAFDEDATVRILRDDLRGEEDSHPSPPTGDEETRQRRPPTAFLFGRHAESQGEDEISDEELQRRLAAARIEEAGPVNLLPATIEPGDAEAGTIQPAGEPAPFYDETPFTEEGLILPAFIEGPEAEEEATTLPDWMQDAQTLRVGPPLPTSGQEPPAELPAGVFAKEATSEGPLAEPPLDDFRELREVALEDYVETLEPEPSLPGAGSGWWRGLSPLKKGFLLGLILLNLALVTVVVLMLLQALVSGALPFMASQPTPATASDLPYPVEVRLPGGWPIGLKAATIRDGTWAPAGPEWLQGTEIRRWIAIPWSKELEAVFKSILPGDTLVLKMSNRDEWTYEVQSVEQVTAERLPELNQNVTSVLIFLADERTKQRWVLIASR